MLLMVLISPRKAVRRRRIDLRRRYRLANGLGSKFGEYARSGCESRGEGVTTPINDVVKLFDQSGGFVVE